MGTMVRLVVKLALLEQSGETPEVDVSASINEDEHGTGCVPSTCHRGCFFFFFVAALKLAHYLT